MIVEPDFLTHWKTRLLVRMLEFEPAPLCVLSLWAHCQQRKTDRLEVDVPTFASICGYPFLGDGADKFYEAMVTCGFIESDGGAVLVHDFAKTNAQLFANWKNGLRGGRPPETHQKPNANPPETQIENGQTDRLDKIGLEKIDKKKDGANESHPTPKLSDESWRQSLVAEPAYQHINIPTEFSKLQRWCEVNHKQPTRRRFVNWLNRIEPPLKPHSGSKTVKSKPFPPPIDNRSEEEIAESRDKARALVESLRSKFKSPEQT